MADLKIAVMGASGRMGRALIRAVHEKNGAVISGGTEYEGSPSIGADLGTLAGLDPLGLTVSAQTADVIAASDAILDFTAPQATIRFARLAAEHGVAHVIGTTGFTGDDAAAIAEAARQTRIVEAGNMSLGVNLLTALTTKVAAALDEDFDIEIVEMHHRHKVDAPSGTALMLAQAAAEGRGVAVTRASVVQATSASRPCAAVPWSAITRSFLRVMVNAYRCRTTPKTALFSPMEPSKQPCGHATKSRAYIP